MNRVMLNKYQFISCANHMLLEAAEYTKMRLKPSKKFDEPCYTASIVTRFPDLMNGNWMGIKFGGCFIHQNPKVKMKGTVHGCEAGDPLVICKKTESRVPLYNATLFQIKNGKGLGKPVKPDNSTQKDLYLKWTVFSFEDNYNNPKPNNFDIYPKAPTPGAQYLFINKTDFEYWDLFDYRCMGYMPVLYTHSMPENIMDNNPDFSFGSFLWDFIHWQNGRPFSPKSDINSDEWSRFIWELIERSENHVFTLSRIGIDKKQRTKGDFFGFLTKNVDWSYHLLYEEWEALLQNSPENSDDGGTDHIELKEGADESPNGLSILYIDLDGVNEERPE